MPTKIFTTIAGKCPFGKNLDIDSRGCRECPEYYRTGTGTFFWCSHPPKKERRKTVITETWNPTPDTKKRGPKPKKAISGPNKGRKTKKQ